MDVDYSDYSDSDYEASRSSVAKMTIENMGPSENKESHEGSGDVKRAQKTEPDLQESGTWMISFEGFVVESSALTSFLFLQITMDLLRRRSRNRTLL